MLHPWLSVDDCSASPNDEAQTHTAPMDKSVCVCVCVSYKCAECV